MSLNIEFKNVNQGDSIIISWKANERTHFGIIDCHEENGNPLLSEIKIRGIKEIEFLIITHPHYDHFSGIPELLNYCLENKIKIKEICYTFPTSVHIVYQKFYQSSLKTNKLFQFFDIIHEHFLNQLTIINDSTKDIQLSAGTYLKFWSPSGGKVTSIGRAIAKYDNNEGSSPNLNGYSTIIEIILNDHQSILLTADARKSLFSKIKKSIKENGRQFKLVQVPHHGSKYNFQEDFYRSLNRINDCPSVISCGFEKKDKIPDLEVVEKLSEMKYNIHSTNYVCGIQEYFGGTIPTKGLGKTWDLFSKRVSLSSSKSQTQFEGDQNFMF